MDQSTYEYIGYVGSVFVALSLSMKNIKHLRILNLTGAILFVVYGIFIDSMPVVVLNAYLTLTNLYHLYKLKNI